MTQPLGFVDSKVPHHFCRLQKSLDGLKQAPRAWYQRFSNFLLSLGFHSTYAYPSLFIHHHGSSVTLVLLYVDDLIITGHDDCYISSLIKQLSLLFEMKHLRLLQHFLGIEIHRTSQEFFLYQSMFAHDLLVCSSMLGCKPCSSPCN